MPVARVPDGEGEHAAEALEAVDAPFLERVHDRLGVGVVGAKRVTATFDQLTPDRRVVVDLAVEQQLHAAVLVRHRLHGLGIEIDDREPPEAEADRAVGRDPRLAAVRPAMVQHFPHTRHVVLGGAEVTPAKGQHAGDAAHERRC